jgi:hypothetical protein
MGWNRRRIYALVASAAIAGTLLVVGPAFGTGHESFGDAVLFDARDGSPEFVYNEQVQALTIGKNSCLFSTDSSLIAVTSTGGQPGIASASMGVRSAGANANGTPCSQVDGFEALTFTPGTSLAGRAFESLVLDLEMTGDAVVEITIEGDDVPFRLQTGTSITICSDDPTAPGCSTLDDSPPFDVKLTDTARVGACQTANSSGPNAATNDNCILTIDPGVNFESFTLTVIDIGTVSLEGGAETAIPSQFVLGGAVLGCGETYTLTKLGVSATYEWITPDTCPDKTYLLDVILTESGSEDVPTVHFQPQSDFPVVDCSVEDNLAACTEEFRAAIAFLPQDETNGPTTGTLEYEPDPNPAIVSFRPMPWCDFDPFDETEWPADAERRDAIPTGESWCIVEVTTTIESSMQTSTTWLIYGIGDPLNRIS